MSEIRPCAKCGGNGFKHSQRQCGCREAMCPHVSVFGDATDERPGLYHKFWVRRTDGSSAPGGKHHGCDYFVLDWVHDPYAPAAARAYAVACIKEYPDLAMDLIDRARRAEKAMKERKRRANAKESKK